MTQIQMFKRDNYMVEIIKKHKGRSNPIASNKLCSMLNELGYETKVRNIGNIVSRIMYERNLPIGYVNGRGYYWATCEEDILPVIADLESRRYEMQRHIDHLRNFIMRKG